MICADSGGSNGYRIRLWKLELQRWANETELDVTVCHYPPGTSKWNQGLRITIAKLGHMESFISRANPDFCRSVVRLFDSVVTNTANCYLRYII